ncbi:MAG TPA: gamma carbonic anhydrase family protein [Elusimicrobiota bacterium]|nr:gamma carbonic anhydrase family protein [Elusimicrobiota bacterium]
MIRDLDGVRPEIHDAAFVHEAAVLVGRVRLGADSSVWPCAVLRGDLEEIVVGDRTNIQDGAVLHTDRGYPTTLGSGITVGHGAILHGCRVKDNCLIGMGAVLLNGCVVEEDSMVAAGALLPPGLRVPQGHLAVGVPAKVIRPLEREEVRRIHENAALYVENIKRYAARP